MKYHIIIKLLEKITQVLKNSEKVTNENDKKKIYISKKKRQNIIDNLRSIIIV